MTIRQYCEEHGIDPESIEIFAEASNMELPVTDNNLDTEVADVVPGEPTQFYI